MMCFGGFTVVSVTPTGKYEARPSRKSHRENLAVLSLGPVRPSNPQTTRTVAIHHVPVLLTLRLFRGLYSRKRQLQRIIQYLYCLFLLTVLQVLFRSSYHVSAWEKAVTRKAVCNEQFSRTKERTQENHRRIKSQPLYHMGKRIKKNGLSENASDFHYLCETRSLVTAGHPCTCTCGERHTVHCHWSNRASSLFCTINGSRPPEHRISTVAALNLKNNSLDFWWKGKHK